jgi:hypothetical protein
MHKITIDAPVEYVMGYLRYGHYEGTLELDDEAYEKFIRNPKAYIKEYCDFVVDDWRIEDIGPIDEISMDEEVY